jgi:hypothetical protein
MSTISDLIGNTKLVPNPQSVPNSPAPRSQVPLGAFGQLLANSENPSSSANTSPGANGSGTSRGPAGSAAFGSTLLDNSTRSALLALQNGTQIQQETAVTPTTSATAPTITGSTVNYTSSPSAIEGSIAAQIQQGLPANYWGQNNQFLTQIQQATGVTPTTAATAPTTTAPAVNFASSPSALEGSIAAQTQQGLPANYWGTNDQFLTQIQQETGVELSVPPGLSPAATNIAMQDVQNGVNPNSDVALVSAVTGIPAAKVIKEGIGLPQPTESNDGSGSSLSNSPTTASAAGAVNSQVATASSADGSGVSTNASVSPHRHLHHSHRKDA